MDVKNLILQAVMMASWYDFDDDCLANAIESEAILLVSFNADDSDRLFI